MDTEAQATKLSSVAFSYILIVRQPGRSISDNHWEEIEQAHIQTWELTTSLLKSRTYSFDGGIVQIAIDWQPLVNRLRQNYQAMSRFHNAVRRGTATVEMLPSNRSVRIPCNVTVAQGSSDRAPEHVATHHTHSFVYDAFLMMNIASPGACNFYSAELRVRKPASRRRQYDRDFSLSEYHFDLATLDGLDGKWPSPCHLPLKSVIDWYNAVRVGATQMPSSRMEKVLFALMHLARSEVSLNTVIWLFYSLETFFDTRPGENFRTLVDRIALLLSATDAQKASLKKKLRTLYDIRSAFVHGGRDVVHPLHNEAMDSRINDSYTELMTAVEFGFAVLLASVQEAVARGWIEANFSEIVSGVDLPV